MQQAGVHAIAGASSGAVNAAICGGDIGRSALAGAFSAGVSKYLGGRYNLGLAGRVAAGADIGGASSLITGGDFGFAAIMGAWTAFTAYECNDLRHDLAEGAKEFARTAACILDKFRGAWDFFSEKAPGAFQNAGEEIYNIWQEGGALPRVALTIAGATVIVPASVAAWYFGAPIVSEIYASSYVWGCENYVASSEIVNAFSGYFTETGPPQGYGYYTAAIRWGYDEIKNGK